MPMYKINSVYRSIPGNKYYMCFSIAYHIACRMQDAGSEVQVQEVIFK